MGIHQIEVPLFVRNDENPVNQSPDYRKSNKDTE